MPGKPKTVPDLTQEKNQDLMIDFPVPNYNDWRREAEGSLKGADFQEKLFTETAEGIRLQPIYTREDIRKLKHLGDFPGFGHCARAGNAAGYLAKPWLVSQVIPARGAGEFNRQLHHDLLQGQDAINLVLDQATRMGMDSDAPDLSLQPAGEGLMISHLEDLSSAIRGVDLGRYPVFISAGFSAVPMLMLFTGFLRKTQGDVLKTEGCVEADPLGFMAREGRLPVSFQSSIDQMAWGIHWADRHLPGFTIVGVDSALYTDAGGDSVSELAFAMAIAVEYINRLLDLGLTVDLILPRIRFTFAIGPHFFMEMAKLRAARMLWKQVTGAYGGEGTAARMKIHARTARYNQNPDDPYQNVLRVTTGAFSAVLGGVNSLQTDVLGEFSDQSAEFSRRIARNIQLILQHESNIRQPVDPAGGSFFVESLTVEIAENAWNLFQKIERQGGMLEALKAGFPQGRVSRHQGLKTETVENGSSGRARHSSGSHINEVLFPERSANLNAFRNARDSRSVASHLEKLKHALDSSAMDIIACGVEAFLAGATLGEISSVLNPGYVHTVADETIEPINTRIEPS